MYDDLNIRLKAEIIRAAVRQGITNISDIKLKYNEFAEGGLLENNKPYYNTDNTHQLNWQGLLSVPHHIVADPNWNNSIETFTPNLLHKLFPEVDVTKGYYANNPYPYENTSLYNPNDKSVTDDTITLDGLHYMHDNPTYETLYLDVVTALKNEPRQNALFDALWDLIPRDYINEKGVKQTRNRELQLQYVEGILSDFMNNKMTDDVREYVQPAIDGYLRRLFAPNYMRGVERGYAEKYPMKEDLKKATDNIEAIMNSYILPEMEVYPTNSYSTGGTIHIKPENRGKFTTAAKSRGMGVLEFANKVLANKDDYSSTMVRRANFARNFGGHRKDDGGLLNNLSNILSTGGPLYPFSFNKQIPEVRYNNGGLLFAMGGNEEEVDRSNRKYYELKLDEPINAPFELTPEEKLFYEENKLYNAGMLPEMVVTPTTLDKKDLKTFLELVPLRKDRLQFSNWVSDYISSGQSNYGNIMRLSRGKFNPQRDYLDWIDIENENNLAKFNNSLNEKLIRLGTLWKESNRPRYSNKPSPLVRLSSKLPLNTESLKSLLNGRAHINTLTNNMYNINGLGDFMAELAHSYKTHGHPSSRAGIEDIIDRLIDYKSTYYKPKHDEYETHQIYEPIMWNYINGYFAPRIRTLNGVINTGINAQEP